MRPVVVRNIERAGLLRTARALFDGVTFLPERATVQTEARQAA